MPSTQCTACKPETVGAPNGDASGCGDLQLQGAETKTCDVELPRGDSAVRPHGGSRYSGTASAGVRV
eukprot:944906-Rhodomonas_salina.2